MDARSTPLPSTIGRFRIEALVGSGGMGEVYKGFDPTLQRVVAVKTVRPDIDRPEFLERMYREAQACARLQHPNIVTIFEAGEFESGVYIAMEYLKGNSLSAVLRRGELTFTDKLGVLVQILEALQHAHTENVIHRDIKPGNVNRQPDGTIKLLDFGLARVIEAKTITLSGAVMGTPYYASPEQLKGERVDHRSDIYSTGALGYEMFSGRRPFEGDNDSVATIVFRVLSEQPAPIDTPWTRKFPQVEQIIARAMAKQPDDRFPTAAAMRDAITEFLTTSHAALMSAQAEAERSVDDNNGSAETHMPVASRPPSAAPAPANVQELEATLRANRSVAPMPIVVSGVPEPTPPVFGSKYQTRELSPAPLPPPRQIPKALWWAIGGVAAVILGVGVSTSGVLFPPRPATSQAESTPTVPTPTAPVGEPAAAALPAPPASVAGTTSSPASGGSPNPTPPPPVTIAPAATGTAKPPTPAPATDPAPATPASAPSAQELYSGGGSNAGLKFRLIKRAGDGQADVNPEAEFRSGDELRFAFESNIDGYLYVATEGSTGQWKVLFPHPEINGGRNAIKRGQQYLVPNDMWFQFDENPGVEKIFIFLSREPLQQLPGFNQPVKETDDTSVPAAVIAAVQGSVRARDLIMVREKPNAATKFQQATYVVNRDQVGKAVTAIVELTHK